MLVADAVARYESPQNAHPFFRVDGSIERKAAESRHPFSGPRRFRFMGAEKVRAGKGKTLPAYEITLKLLGDDAQAVMQHVQAGQVFAFEPRNHRKDVAKIRKLLGNPQGSVQVPVLSSYLGTEGEQRVTVNDALSGVVDLSAPSIALVKLLDERVRAVGGMFLEQHKIEDVVSSYTVDEVIAHAQQQYVAALERLREKIAPHGGAKPAYLDLFPAHVLNVRDLVLNQPPMHARPYTLSDFNRETGEIKIIVGDVSVTLSGKNPFGLTDKNGQPFGERVKRDGIATGMLRWMRLHNAKKGPFDIDGSVDTEYHKIAVENVTEYTESIQWAEKPWRVGKKSISFIDDPLSRISQVDMVTNPDSRYKTGKPVETLYLVATGTGIAPYLALLRDVKRKKERGEKLPPYKIILTLGGRYQQDAIAHKELRHYVDEGLLDAYHFISSADSRESVYTRSGKETFHHPPQVKYAQHALAYHYKDRMRDELGRDRAYVYLCGTERAQGELIALCPEKLDPVKKGEIEGKKVVPHAMFGTASLPDRFRDMFNDSITEPVVESQKQFLGMVADAWSVTLAQSRGMGHRPSHSDLQQVVEGIVEDFRPQLRMQEEETRSRWGKVLSTSAAAVRNVVAKVVPIRKAQPEETIEDVRATFAKIMERNGMILHEAAPQAVRGR